MIQNYLQQRNGIFLCCSNIIRIIRNPANFTLKKNIIFHSYNSNKCTIRDSKHLGILYRALYSPGFSRSTSRSRWPSTRLCWRRSARSRASSRSISIYPKTRATRSRRRRSRQKISPGIIRSFSTTLRLFCF